MCTYIIYILEFNRFKRNKPATAPIIEAPPPKISTDNLPVLKEILDEIGLQHMIGSLIKMGVVSCLSIHITLL